MNQNVFAYVNPDSEQSSAGKLSGHRIAIPQNLSVRDWPTNAGSLALENYVALEDAVVVERLREAGAHIAGSTCVAELAFGLHGDTASAAVTSSSADAALITDTLGEARVAGAETGLLGFKPTSGTISRYGLIGLVPSMEALGVVAAKIDTILNVLQAIVGPDKRDFSLGSDFPDFSFSAANTSSWKAVVISESLDQLSPSETEAFEAALPVIERTGGAIVRLSVPDYRLFRTVHQIVSAAEASSSAGKYDGVRYGHRTEKADNWNEMYVKSRGESFGPLIKAFLLQGAYFQFRDYPAFENACRVRRRLIGALDQVLAQADVIVAPTRRSLPVPDQPSTISQLYDRFGLTLAANVTGLPALSIPGILSVDGGDLGLQLVGRRLHDGSLLGYASRIMSAQGECV